MLSNRCAVEDSWESLGLQGDQKIDPKGSQPCIFIKRTDDEAEAPVFWPPDVKSRLIGKDSCVGNIEGKSSSGWQRMRWLDSITVSMDMNLSKLWEIPKDRGAWHSAVHGISKSQTWLRDWKKSKDNP